MDDFDKIIQNAEQTHQASVTFVEETMQQISSKPVKSKRGLKLWLPALISAMAVVVVVFIAVPFKNHFSGSTDDTSRVTTSQSTTKKSSTQPAASAGTDDATLNSDLSGISTAMNQETSDQDTANGALNDSAEQITVPSE